MLRNRKSAVTMPPPVRRLWRIFEQTITRWNKNDGTVLAASMAYYAAFSFFPLLLVLLSGLGLALQFSSSARSAQASLLEIIKQHTGEGLAEQVDAILSEVRTRAPYSGFIGLVTFLFGAIGVFSQLESAFDRLWHDPTPHSHGLWAAVRNALWNRLKAFITLLGLGIVVLVGFLADLALAALRNSTQELPLDSAFWHWIQWGSTAAINAAVMMLVYKMIPRQPVRWAHAAIGGVAVAVVLLIGGQIMSRFLIGGNYSAYGVVGSFIAMMLWVYYASIVLFLGAQLVQVIGYPDNGGAASGPGNSAAPAAANKKVK